MFTARANKLMRTRFLGITTGIAGRDMLVP